VSAETVGGAVETLHCAESHDGDADIFVFGIDAEAVGR
jgi:hypothetical protein